VIDASGRFEWAYIVLRDINLRKWAEERQLLQERAMESTGEGIAIVDARHPDQPIIYVNPGLERLTAHPAEELLGRPWTALLPSSGDDAKAATLQEDFRNGEPFTTELHDVREDGTSLWYRLSLTAAHDSGEAVTHYIAVLSDVTALMETEEKLKETNAKLEAAYRRMKRNLDAAARLQQALLPTALPEMPSVRFEWCFEPAEDLSGVIQLDDDHVALYLLDVTGHGVASAMLSVTVSRSLIPLHSNTALLYDREGPDGAFVVASPSKVATRLAMRFPWDPNVGQFFTLVYGVLDCRTHEFRYTCAGHAPPICLTPAGAWITKRSRDLPIGIGGNDFEEHTLELVPGARLYLYSDGVTEARNLREGGFGRQRFLDTLRESRTLTLGQSLDTVLARLKDWRAGDPAHDDVSLLAVEIRGT